MDYKEYNIKFFKRVAPFYNSIEFLLSPLRKRILERIKGKNCLILDLACGTGSQSIVLANSNHYVVGLDLSKDMLKYAKYWKGDFIFLQGDASKVPYLNSQFDVSLISFGLHEMPRRIGIKVLGEMIRTTKPNGQIIIAEYHRPKNKIIRWFGLRIPKLWETKYWGKFMDVGLNYYLNKVNLKIIRKETYLLDNIQIVECINQKKPL